MLWRFLNPTILFCEWKGSDFGAHRDLLRFRMTLIESLYAFCPTCGSMRKGAEKVFSSRIFLPKPLLYIAIKPFLVIAGTFIKDVLLHCCWASRY